MMFDWFKKKLLSKGGESSPNKLVVWWVSDLNDGKDLRVGELVFDGEYFIFRYDGACPETLKIKGLDYPESKSKHLPPFFAARLPSLKRPDIAPLVENSENPDYISLLGQLSAESPISPYNFRLIGKDAA